MTQSLSSKAYDGIRDLIQRGVYLPGMMLPEQELSDALHMSRTPIREALQHLSDDMIVVIKPRVGAMVATLDFPQLCNLYEARESTEGMIARLNCQKGFDVSAYQAVYDEYSEAMKIEDSSIRIPRLDEVTEDYNRILSEGCGNPILAKFATSLQHKVHLLSTVTHFIPFFPDLGAEERQRVLSAIISRDADEAERQARRRIQCCLKRILENAMPQQLKEVNNG